MQIWAEPRKSALPICNYSQILYQFLTFTQNLKRSPYHNNSFLDTITRSLFMANQLNALSTPLIANVFFLLEKYFEVEEQNNILKAQIL